MKTTWKKFRFTLLIPFIVLILLYAGYFMEELHLFQPCTREIMDCKGLGFYIVIFLLFPIVMMSEFIGVTNWNNMFDIVGVILVILFYGGIGLIFDFCINIFHSFNKKYKN